MGRWTEPERRRRHAAAALAVGLVAALLTACSGPASPRPGSAGAVVAPGFRGGSEAVPNIAAHAPYSIADLSICWQGGGGGTVTSVTLDDATNLKLTAFATAPNPNLVPASTASMGAGPESLRTLGFAPAGRAVASCQPPRRGTQGEPTAPSLFGVTFERGDAAPVGRAAGLRMTYRSRSGEAGTVDLPLAVALCAHRHGCVAPPAVTNG